MANDMASSRQTGRTVRIAPCIAIAALSIAGAVRSVAQPPDGIQQQAAKTGRAAMTSDAEFNRLIDTFPADSAKQEALTAKLADDAHKVARQAARLWSAENDGARKDAAFSILDSLQELSIVPLLEVGPPADPAQIPQYLRMVTEHEGELRKGMVAKLEPLLRDHRQIPPQPHFGPKPEGDNPPRRVCDEAYLSIRHLLHAALNDLEEEAVNETAFLNSPEKARNAEIERAHSSGNWSRSVTLMPDHNAGRHKDHPDGPLPRE
jgi:hypothetical protein